MTANEKQEGGQHYKKLAIQHWDYVEANGIPYLEACAIKYLTRWRDKGGVVDLRKAIHYIEKRIELEEAKLVTERIPEAGVANDGGSDQDTGPSLGTGSQGDAAGQRGTGTV